ncbi:Stk1 family PASTA domain-containing Ser/Thr kinase [Arthrobacter sp. Br18]|uniref:Stk1 family PASTA domain-containing Ser/Thr kinase n=1 Tax=Arthrobacter sp. Br18 TaxID=1312954 RepID=UPI000479E92F|nr:Stk1 family PASTA domain-containing Ser/Thr kinase [Arthrobacter sp. Br18]
MQEPRKDPLTGALIEGRYLVLSRLARGGMSTVYLATDQRLDRSVALKVLYPHLAEDSSFLHRFEQEAKSAARLSHPHVVGVLDQGMEDGDGIRIAYLVMEYVPGRTLRDLLRERGRLTPRQALALLDPVVEGLGAAHAEGLVHRDVKPENVLLASNGQIKIADFGLARAVSTSTGTGTLVGTVAYLSPELVTGGSADAQSDIYSVGIVLFELLTGRQPFTGDTPIQIAFQHAHSSVPAPSTLLPGLPPDIDELVQWCTSPDPEDRPVDGLALLGELRHIRTTLTDEELDFTSDVGAVPPDPGAEGATGVIPTAGPSGKVPPASDPLQSQPMAAHPTTVLRRDVHETRVIGAVPRGRPGPPPGTTRQPDPARSAGSSQSPRSRQKQQLRDAQRPQKSLRGPAARRRTTVLVALLVLLAVLAAVSGWFFGAGPGGIVAVPDVANRPLAEARALLDEQGFTSISTNEVFDDAVTAGLVVGTQPPAAVEVRRFERVGLLVSKGPELFAVPDVTGENQVGAAATLVEENLSVGTVSEEFAEDVEEGRVVSQDPAAGTEVRKGFAVAVVVSQGPRPIPIPEVTGLPRDAAVRAIEDAGLTAEVLDDAVNSVSVPEGAVALQSPATGDARRGTPIELTLSAGPRILRVPNVFSNSEQEAVAALEASGFRVVVDYTFGSSVLGLVAGQDLTGNQPEGSVVTITVT